MSQEKYIGMDVHQATISAAVMDAQGKLIMECLLETKAATILEFLQGLHGTLAVTFEEGTSAAWLHDLLKPHVSRLLVCDPRKAALLKDGNKSDRIDYPVTEGKDMGRGFKARGSMRCSSQAGLRITKQLRSSPRGADSKRNRHLLRRPSSIKPIK